ncbi:MAG TPA: phenylacetate--CoA ligase family protein [Pirellulales bacterium]|nr:phenylacetate--CoA ligase family protein [Pirellulales bacterium]
MPIASPESRRRLESLDPAQLAAHQLERLNALLAEILPANAFYATKLASATLPLVSLHQLSELPYTFKDELLGPPGSGGWAANLTWPRERYVRYHQTSGTRGRPLAVLDTADDWQWWMDCWNHILDAAGVTHQDVAFFAFSFGPFVGFWSAHDAALARGCQVVPGGGMNTLARLDLMRATEATVVFCTPSYALHLAETARHRNIDLGAFPVRVLVLAGEPGGSVPAVRHRIEDAWQAHVFDHAGATEIGPWGFADEAARGLYVNEAQFLAEFRPLDHAGSAQEGDLAELVLTTLGRAGSPVIRYRTGDLVRPTWPDDRATRFVLLEGGVLGRVDDMMIIRGVNIFASALDQILRSFPEVSEYRVTARKGGEMDQLFVEIEDHLDKPQRVAEELQLRLGLKVEVAVVPLGTLPRFEGKGARIFDER